MANAEHLARLTDAGGDWNRWRDERPDVKPDLRGAELSNEHFNKLNLEGVDFATARLVGTFFMECCLPSAVLAEADLRGARFLKCDLAGAVACSIETLEGRSSEEEPLVRALRMRGILCHGARPGANLHGADVHECSVEHAKFDCANLKEVSLIGTSFAHSSFRGASLSPRMVVRVSMREADLRGANLGGANLQGVDFQGADLRGACLAEARLGPGHMTQIKNLKTGPSGVSVESVVDYETASSFRGADLRGADLSGASLLQADFSGADLSGARVYGTSSWKVKLDGAKQTGLIVSRPEESILTVDDLEVAQFIYMLLDKPRIRSAIDTITSKVVLVLGRFSAERMTVLNAVVEALRNRDRVPMMFDFDRPANRDLTETIQTLAHLARYVVADLSDPRCTPHEVASFIKDLEVPLLPIIAAAQEPYAMFEDLNKYPWVLPLLRYRSREELIANFDESVMGPCEAKRTEIVGRKGLTRIDVGCGSTR